MTGGRLPRTAEMFGLRGLVSFVKAKEWQAAQPDCGPWTRLEPRILIETVERDVMLLRLGARDPSVSVLDQVAAALASYRDRTPGPFAGIVIGADVGDGLEVHAIDAEGRAAAFRIDYGTGDHGEVRFDPQGPKHSTTCGECDLTSALRRGAGL